MDNDGHPQPPVLEVLEDCVHAPVLRHGQHLANDVVGSHLRPQSPQIALILESAHHVLGVHRPDYLVREPSSWMG